ncbi:Gfo/Idh/MocA family protein [Gilvimarinus chinensis]|uniref:Gfo/Idh/MocA family protein n=1 Tax=Gilvimarinus chinensis TaxID=396005 RepID=UPI0003601BB1|nr:Gfo/Idh/MocA family oxidoreductase [Gilvimarinus chinensis]
MRIASVGLGDIAQKAYLPLVCRHPAITPVLCTRKPELLQQLGSQYRVEERYTDYRELLCSKPDAVMIHSSTDSHAALAMQALEAGIAVFVDKPVSDTLADCEAVIELAARKNLPLFCGFNRRYAPLYQGALAARPLSIHYQKNRHALPAQARQFIYDDFIHVLDFVCHAGGFPAANWQVMTGHEQGLLAHIQVSWSHAGQSLSAAMNRLCGRTFERLDYSATNESWHVENLRQGSHCANNETRELTFGDWQDTLFKRGFVSMLEDFLTQLRTGQADTAYLDQLRRLHQLCEALVIKVSEEHTRG